MEQLIYLDNAATTPVLPEVVNEVKRSLLEDFGNPSSVHRLGLRSERKIKDARNMIGQLIHVPSEDIVFTSGGTESNNLAILGVARAKQRQGKHCITTEIEHSSVLNSFSYLEQENWDISYLQVDSQGIIDIEALKRTIREDTILVSIGHVNSEIGSIQPIKEIGLYLKNNYPHVIFHVDAVQSYGRLNIRPLEWGIHLLSISAHKVHGPKGVGALYIKKGTPLVSLQWGGGQEFGIRSGTENLPGIVGFGEASHWLINNMDEGVKRISKKKTKLWEEIVSILPKATLNGPNIDEAAPHIMNFSVPGIRGETLLHVLESHGVYVSTGSACTSRKVKISHVLRAIKASPELGEGAVRLSLSYLNNEDELSLVAGLIKKSVDQVKRFTRR